MIDRSGLDVLGVGSGTLEVVIPLIWVEYLMHCLRVR